MKPRRTIIISNDALVTEDYEYLLTKPLMRELMAKGSWVKTLNTVYPSITYCCHASMVTGCYPEKTHLYNNEVDGFGCSDWTWERHHLQAKTLADAAKEAGGTVANVFWPVLGQDPSIDYNIPEYWSQSPEEPLTVALARMGTSQQVIDEIVKPNLYYIEGHQRQHPFCDEFVFACARDMLVKYKPDLLLVHPAGIDGMRHRYGLFNEYVTEQLDYTYYWIEKIVRALKEMGEWEQTDLILTSDHGQMNMIRCAHPNVLLSRAGLMTLDEAGKVVDKKAYVKAVGASAQVFLTDPSPEAYNAVKDLFTEAAASGLYGFERCYTAEEAQRETHLAGDFAFVLETDGYTSFGPRVTGDYYTSYDLTDYRLGRATHGYLPHRGPQPSMLCVGPSFRAGAVVERRNTVDMAPTVAKIRGWSLPDADGTVIDEILL
ncbi:MAG: alkaline phosphatase family protein [Clostridia bacterium]|nr:alkaline phosphatase family protein [Clostridia bacterium]MBQ5820256.1 alkaline phosphatase family protein [Clostridia bacterium]